MSKTILCPYCFNKFDSFDAMMRCTNTALKNSGGQQVEVCQNEPDPLFNDHWLTTKNEKHVFRPSFSFKEKLGLSKLQEKPCNKCGVMSDKFVCPHCHNWLPTEMIEKGSEIISVIGGPSSGKSNYIVTLIQQLLKYRGKLGLNVTLQEVGRNDDEKTRNRYNNFKEVIFTDHQALDKTVIVKRPIPWIVRLESLSSKKAIYLVFYDTAGESFNDAEKIRNEKYFKESKAVITVFDTLGIPKIKRTLRDQKGNLSNRGIQYRADDAYSYSETWDSLKNFATSGHKDIYKKPTAFVFTKFDAIIENQRALNCDVDVFTDPETNQFVNSSYIKTGVLDLNAIDEASKAIESYLKDPEIWDDDAIAVEITSAYQDKAKFFGVSSLGPMKDAVNIKVDEDDEVRPIRVTDPLIWILHMLGGFDIKVSGK